jgi:hypothetical protein
MEKPTNCRRNLERKPLLSIIALGGGLIGLFLIVEQLRGIREQLKGIRQALEGTTVAGKSD